jgi:hypothetical protein
MGANYSVYKLPYISTAISVNDNIRQCLAKAEQTNDIRACITNNITTASNSSSMPLSNVAYFGPGEQVQLQNGKTVITNAPAYPSSTCYENFDSSQDSIESNKIFCFSGTFTILTIFVLILLLVFINANTKNQLSRPLL